MEDQSNSTGGPGASLGPLSGPSPGSLTSGLSANPPADLYLQQQALTARLGQAGPNLADLNPYELALRAMMGGVSAQAPPQQQPSAPPGQQQGGLSLPTAQLLQTHQYAQALQLLLANPALALQGAAVSSLINPYGPYAAAAAAFLPQLPSFAPAMLIRQQQYGQPVVSSATGPAVSTSCGGQLLLSNNNNSNGLGQGQQGLTNGHSTTPLLSAAAASNHGQHQHQGLQKQGSFDRIPPPRRSDTMMHTQTQTSSLNRPGKPCPLPAEISILTGGGNGPPSAGVPPSPSGTLGDMDKGGSTVLRSPEAVEQHISKLISDNEAIVQPSPVLIRKRNSRYYAPLGATKANSSTGSISPRTGSDSSSGGQASSSPQMTVPADPSPFHKPFSGVSHTAPRFLHHQGPPAPQPVAPYRQVGSITQGVAPGVPQTLVQHPQATNGRALSANAELSRSTLSTAALSSGEFSCPFCRLGFKTDESLRHHESRCGHPDADLHRRTQNCPLGDALSKRNNERQQQPPQISGPPGGPSRVEGGGSAPPAPQRSHHPLKKRILAAAESLDLSDTNSSPGLSNNPASPRNALCPTPPLVLNKHGLHGGRSSGNMTSLPQSRTHLPSATVSQATNQPATSTAPPQPSRLTRQATVYDHPSDRASGQSAMAPGQHPASGMLVVPQASGQNLLVLLTQDAQANSGLGQPIPLDPYQLMLHQGAFSYPNNQSVNPSRLNYVATLNSFQSPGPVILTAVQQTPAGSANQGSSNVIPLISSVQSKTLAALSTVLRPNLTLSDRELTQNFTPYTLCCPSPPSAQGGPSTLATTSAIGSPPRAKTNARQITQMTWSCTGGKLGPMTSRLVNRENPRSSNFARWTNTDAKPFEAKWILTVMSAYDVRARNAFPLKYVSAGGPFGTRSKKAGSAPLTPTVVWGKNPAPTEKGIPAVPPKMDLVVAQAQTVIKAEKVTPSPSAADKKCGSVVDSGQQGFVGVKREAPSPPRSTSPPTPKRIRLFHGAYKSLEPYSYVKGKGRGRYMCEYCAIRCVKPSVLKKHLRTHYNVRPFTCPECHFAFKTKGNLTKHLKVAENGMENSCCGADDSESLSAESGDDEGISFEEQRNHAIRLRKRHPGPKRRYSVSSLEALLVAARDPSPENSPSHRACESAPPDLRSTTTIDQHIFTKIHPPHNPAPFSEKFVERPPSTHQITGHGYGVPSTGAGHGGLVTQPVLTPGQAALAGQRSSQGQQAKQKQFLAKSEEKCICSKCGKQCPTMGQLRLHMNVHFIESTSKRTEYRCLRCSSMFRSKPALVKHQHECTGIAPPNHPAGGPRRPASDRSPVRGQGSQLANGEVQQADPRADPSPDRCRNPRPFACEDCAVAFRIHGHLAKHLRSKLHIMKLECQDKLPIGTYAKIEESAMNSLSEIDTTDCESSMASLRRIAMRLNLPVAQAKPLPAAGPAEPARKASTGSSNTAVLAGGQAAKTDHLPSSGQEQQQANSVDVSCAIAMLDFARQEEPNNGHGPNQLATGQKPGCAAVPNCSEPEESRLVIIEDEPEPEAAKPVKTGPVENPGFDKGTVVTATCSEKPRFEPPPSSEPKKPISYNVVADVWVPPTVEIPVVSTLGSLLLGGQGSPLPVKAIPDSKPVLMKTPSAETAKFTVTGTGDSGQSNAENEKASCGFCSQDFESKIELKIHHLTVHIQLRDGADYRCPQKRCEKVFPTAENLRQHLRKHFYSPHAFIAQFPGSNAPPTGLDASGRVRPSSAHQFLATRPPSLQASSFRQGPLSSKSLDSPELTSPDSPSATARFKAQLAKMDSFDSLSGFPGTSSNPLPCRESPASDSSDCSADSTGVGAGGSRGIPVSGPPILPLVPRLDFPTLPASIYPSSVSLKRRFEDAGGFSSQNQELPKKPRPIEPMRPKPIPATQPEPTVSKPGHPQQMDAAYLLRAVAGCSPYLTNTFAAPGLLTTTGVPPSVPSHPGFPAPHLPPGPRHPPTNNPAASLLSAAPSNPSSLLNSSQGSLNPQALITAGHGAAAPGPSTMGGPGSTPQGGSGRPPVGFAGAQTCPLCSRVCESVEGLQEHFLGHLSSRPFVCDQCDAGFTSQQALRLHAASHAK